MAADFDPAEFVNRIGQKLVMEFDHASAAGTPGLIGSARENPARKQLEKLMPAFALTGSGIVIDSFGARSSQQDIIFFERDYCPVCSINDTAEATYFPVEGVIATGEVKSIVDKGVLFDALGKIKSAKALKRFSVKIEYSGLSASADFRTYGSGMSITGRFEEGFNQECNCKDQVFGFIICKSFRSSPDAILANITDFGREEGFEFLPHIIVSLDDGFIQNCSLPDISLQQSSLTANAVAFVPERPRAFTFLVNELRRHAREGRTVPLYAFDRYMMMSAEPLPQAQIRRFV